MAGCPMGLENWRLNVRATGNGWPILLKKELFRRYRRTFVDWVICGQKAFLVSNKLFCSINMTHSAAMQAINAYSMHSIPNAIAAPTVKTLDYRIPPVQRFREHPPLHAPPKILHTATKQEPHYSLPGIRTRLCAARIG